jgi:small subunit ribosomal protein S3Ae
MARKLKGKEWYTLIAPKIFDEKVLGETPVGDPESIKERVLTLSLVNLINDPSKYYLKFSFKVDKIEDKKAFTQFWGFECLRDYISRMVRHGLLRIDNVIDIETKDNVKIRVKTITLTSRKARKQIELLLRKFVTEKLKEEIPKITLEDFIKNVLDDSLRRIILDEGSKIYPVYKFEVRKVERLS